MKKEYKKPSIEVVKIEQTLMLPTSVYDQESSGQSYSRMGRDNSGFEDED